MDKYTVEWALNNKSDIFISDMLDKYSKKMNLDQKTPRLPKRKFTGEMVFVHKVNLITYIKEEETWQI